MSDAADSLIAPGTLVGRYQIIRVLGQGGMGCVYEGFHLDLKRRVAIKTLNRSAADNPEIRARFIREGEAASRIRHPHIVDIYDVGTYEGAPYLVMEFLDGEDLAQLVQRHGALQPVQVADLMLPVLAALAAAHDAGIIHRDMKPANIFLSYSPHGDVHPKVLDFGISKIADDVIGGGGPGSFQLTKTAAMLGTPSYMSPEQAQGAKHVDARTDQYSLGVIMYQCAVGAVPFHADSLYQLLHSIVQGQYPPPRTRCPTLPEAFEQVIMRAMGRTPEERFDSVRTLARALLPFASERGRVLWERTFGPPMTMDALRPPGSASTSGAWTASTGGGMFPGGTVTTLSGSSAERPLPVAPMPRSRAPMVFVATVVLLGGLGGVGYFLFGRGHSASNGATTAAGATGASYVASVSTSPAGAQIRVDGEVVGTGSFTRQYPQNGVTHTMLVTAEGFEPRSLTFHEPPPGLVELAPRTAAAPSVAAAPVAVAAPPDNPVAVPAAPTPSGATAPATEPGVAAPTPAVAPAATAPVAAPTQQVAAAPVATAPEVASPEPHRPRHNPTFGGSPPRPSSGHRPLINGAPIIR